METKDPNPSGSDPTDDQPTLDGIPAPPPALAGLTARYDILGEVGRGGMGIVYKARDRETGELVALKALKPEIAADQTAMERFKNELRLARKITHKNVCRIHDFYRTENTVYISMEFVDGESLRHILLRSGGLRAGKAVQIGQQICDGLREVQENEIERLRQHMDTGRITEADFLLLVGTRVYGKSVADYAREAGMNYQAAKKRRQRAEAAIRRFEGGKQ